MYNYKLDKLIRILKTYTSKVEKPKEPSLNPEETWKCLIEQICVRGGSKSIDLLIEHGEKNKFLSQLSLEKMPVSYNKTLQILTDFRATRFRPSAAKTIIENYHRCFSKHEFKFISLLRENIPERKLTKERIEAERRVRTKLINEHAFIWVFRRKDKWEVYDWKKKPISDWLKDIGFAVTLFPFDTRVKKVSKELGIKKVTDENYEEIEDLLIKHACRTLGILPIQLDKIFYRNSDEIIRKLNSANKTRTF